MAVGNQRDEIRQLAQQLEYFKSDCIEIRGAVLYLQEEKDQLRQAVRKLKMENMRLKTKVKLHSEQLKSLGVKPDRGEDDDSDIEKDYDEIGKDYILVGGSNDPFSLRYGVPIKDTDEVEHKSAERFYWYKMAKFFNDEDAAKKILEASGIQQAEEAMQEIKGYNEKRWDAEKLEVWCEAQRLKFDQVRWISSLLVETGDSYIAVASQDRLFGTGWRKTRDEANQTVFWDGANEGGKWLMKFRKQLRAKHEWDGPAEKQDIQHRLTEMRRFVWRKQDPKNFTNGGRQGGVGNNNQGNPRQNNGGGQNRGGNQQNGGHPYRNQGGLGQHFGQNNNNNNRGGGGGGNQGQMNQNQRRIYT